MVRPAICYNCGQGLHSVAPVQGNRVQCPSCGAVCELPARPAEEKRLPPNHSMAPPPPAALMAAADPEPRDEHPRPRTTTPAPPTTPPVSQAGLLTCDFCGELVRLPGKKRYPATCPNCGSAVAAPTAKPMAESAPQPMAPLPAEPEVHGSQEDDGRPYPLAGGRRFKCPGCRRLLEPDAEVCAVCGLNWKTGARLARAYEPARRRWVTGLSPRRRLALFLAGQAVVLPVSLVGAGVEGAPVQFLFSWLLFSGLAAFLLGTYDQVDLKRNRRGRVDLSVTWRICFVTRPATRIRLEDYEGFTTGVENKSGCFSWLFLIVFLSYGIIPGVLWWYFTMKRDTYFVALTQDHGYPALMLYRGWSKEQMDDITAALRDVAGLSAS